MIEAVISSSVLILIICFLRIAFRGKLKNTLIYSLWLIAAIRLMLPFPLMESGISLMNSAQKILYYHEEQTGAYEDNFSVTEEMPVMENKTTETVSPVSENTLSLRGTLRFIRVLITFVMLMWFTSVNIFYFIKLKKSRKKLSYENSPLEIYTSDIILSPCIFGLFVPAIYIPENSAEDSETLEYVIAHEICHYCHGDMLWSAVRYILLSVYWFDPFVWTAAILSKKDCETACDEAAIKRVGAENRLRYGKTIIDLIPLKRTEGFGVVSTSMASGKNDLKKRIGFIADQPKNKFSAAAITLAVTVLSVGCAYTSAENVPETVTEETQYELSESKSDDGSTETAAYENKLTDDRIEAEVTDRNGRDGKIIFFPPPERYEAFIYTDGIGTAENTAPYFKDELSDFISSSKFSAAEITYGEKSRRITYERSSHDFYALIDSVSLLSPEILTEKPSGKMLASVNFYRANGGFSSLLRIEFYENNAYISGDDFTEVIKFLDGKNIPDKETLKNAYRESRHFEACFDYSEDTEIYKTLLMLFGEDQTKRRSI